MIKRSWALSIFVVVVLIFMIGLTGCDMGSKTIAEIEETDKIVDSKAGALFVVSDGDYDISGQKINADTDNGIEGWEITLYKSNENWKKVEELGSVTTGNQGYYGFLELEDGNYIVEEEDKTGWIATSSVKQEVPINGEDVDGINFYNAPLYSITGYKLNADTEDGIKGWEITLTKLNDEEFTPLTINTDENGYYIFEGLRAGSYQVVEEMRAEWEAVGQTSYDITLPAEGDESEPKSYGDYNFENRPVMDLECFDETIWAANDGPLTERFVDRGNWATYIMYDIGDGSKESPEEYDLYAGQYHQAGTLEVYDDNGNIFVRYLIESDEDDSYKDGYCGSWSYLTEYHLQVVDDFNDFDDVTTRQGNPIPGQFEYSDYYDIEKMVNDTGWIEVEKYFEGTVYIAAHGVAQWCGYLCEIE